MRQLTFHGFLEQYVSSLSSNGACGMYQLAREVSGGNHRLREPLCLFALTTGKMNTLLKASKDTVMYPEYAAMSERFSDGTVVVALSEEADSLPREYTKIWRSYKSELAIRDREVRMKELVRQKVARLKDDKDISVYRICRDLDLNYANVNHWLKNGDTSRVSLSTAKSVLAYLER